MWRVNHVDMHEKMLNILNYQGHSDHKDAKFPFYLTEPKH